MQFRKKHIGYFVIAAIVGAVLANVVFADNTPRQVQFQKQAFFNSAKDLCGFKVLQLEEKTIGSMEEGEAALYEKLKQGKFQCYHWLGELLNSDYASEAQFSDPRFESMYPKTITP
tara:strand:+ start:205 stop:552 length:348 start_codon:yes stop_codon:yes gene_type:complete